MKYSVSELAYLRTSLSSQPLIRPDSRKRTQLRPVDSSIDILPAANGSASVTASDGSECIVGLKTKVVKSHTDLIEVCVDINGVKDNDALISSLNSSLQHMLLSCPQLLEKLYLNHSYSYRLFVDCVVLSSSSHPLGLLSLGIFQALKTAKLAKMIPSDATGENDQIDEIPQFYDSWDEAVRLCDTWTPPVMLIVAVIGQNVILDPTHVEQQVAEAVLCLAWKDHKVASPIRTMDTKASIYTNGFSPARLLEVYDLVEEAGPSLLLDLERSE